MFLISGSLKPNTHRRRRRNSTVDLSRVGVGSVYWVLAPSCLTKSGEYR